jgi:hypothetical protein
LEYFGREKLLSGFGDYWIVRSSSAMRARRDARVRSCRGIGGERVHIGFESLGDL